MTAPIVYQNSGFRVEAVEDSVFWVMENNRRNTFRGAYPTLGEATRLAVHLENSRLTRNHPTRPDAVQGVQAGPMPGRLL